MTPERIILGNDSTVWSIVQSIIMREIGAFDAKSRFGTLPTGSRAARKC